MLLSFKEKNPQKIVCQLQNAIKEQVLEDKVTIALEKKLLNVAIEHLGSSNLIFKPLKSPTGSKWQLDSEEIAWTHLIFKNEALDYLKSIVETAGGKIKTT